MLQGKSINQPKKRETLSSYECMTQWNTLRFIGLGWPTSRSWNTHLIFFILVINDVVKQQMYEELSKDLELITNSKVRFNDPQLYHLTSHCRNRTNNALALIPSASDLSFNEYNLLTQESGVSGSYSLLDYMNISTWEMSNITALKSM